MKQNKQITSPGITFVGISTPNIEAMKRFAGEVLGYQQTDDESDFVAFTTPQGQRLEFFSPDYYPHFTTGPVPGFEVPDFDAALQWLNDNKLEILNDIPDREAGTRWVHFKGPDGNVYEFVYHPELNKQTT